MVFLPFEFKKGNLNLQSITKKVVIVVKMFHGTVASTASYIEFMIAYCELHRHGFVKMMDNEIQMKQTDEANR